MHPAEKQRLTWAIRPKAKLPVENDTIQHQQSQVANRKEEGRWVGRANEAIEMSDSGIPFHL